MTLEQAAIKLAGQLNDIVDDALLNADDTLRAQGATRFERESLLESYRAQLAEWRSKAFAEVFASLQRDGDTLQ